MTVKLPDFKQGPAESQKQQDPTSSGQDDNKDNSFDDLESEADKLLEQQPGEFKPEDEDDETVTLKKDDFKKLTTERDNYRTGLTSLKDKIKGKKKVSSKEDAPAPQSQAPANKESSQPDRILQVNQKKAIAEATKNPDIEKNWTEIMTFFKYTRDPDLVENIVADIDDAFTLWKKHNNIEDTKNNSSDQHRRNLGNDNARPTGGSGSQGGSQNKKTIIPKRTAAKDWYK